MFFLAVQQIGDLLHVEFIRCRGGDRVDQAAVGIDADLRLYAEIPLIPRTVR
jgi:hypothetical protein